MVKVLLLIKWRCDELSIFLFRVFLFLLHKINQLFSCKLIVITLTTWYIILYLSLTRVYCSWNSCTCCAVIRFDVDTILRRNCSAFPVIHIVSFICVTFSYGLQKFHLFCPEVVIRYMIIGKHNFPILLSHHLLMKDSKLIPIYLTGSFLPDWHIDTFQLKRRGWWSHEIV